MPTKMPLIAQVSQKHRDKAKKYAVSPIIEVSSPYKHQVISKQRNKTRNSEVERVDPPRSENSKKYYEYEKALRRRDFRQVLWMIMNADIPANYESRTGETALLAVVAAKDRDALATLMKCGISIDTPNMKGYTPLMKAIAVAVPEQNRMLKEKILRSLPRNNIKEHEGSEDIQGLNTGAYDNDIIQQVLAYEPTLLQTDHSGRTALDWAKLTGNTQAAFWLEKRQKEKSLQHQSLADCQERVKQCMELLHRHEHYIQCITQLIAPQFFNEDELIVFLKGTTISSIEFEDALNDLQKMKDTLMFQSKFFINLETKEGWTPLTKCAAFGYLAGVQELIAMGSDLHYETRLRHTAMTWACYCGHEAVVLHLLRIGVDLSQKTRDGKTALLHAISNSKVQIVHHLLIAQRVQCLPTKPIDTFSSEIVNSTDSQLKVKSIPADNMIKEIKHVETEWHVTFLKKIQWKDQTGNDAIKLAHITLELAKLETNVSDIEELSAFQVYRQVETAIKDAEEHKTYVDNHADRTKLTLCHHTGCTFRTSKDVLSTHELHHCMKRTITCENCSTTLISENRSKHDTNFCPMRRVSCTNFQYGCHEQMLFQDRDIHLNHHCRKRDLQCRLLCGAIVPFDELDNHENTQCPLRIMTCEEGCHATFTANVAKRHRRHECVKRTVFCTKKDAGCAVMVKVEDMVFHLSTLCELRELPCKWNLNGCEEKIGGVSSARYNHETNECLYRLVSCKNGCELTGQLLACFTEEHYQWQCILEEKSCPNKCTNPSMPSNVFHLPEHLMMVHHLPDAGDCSLRKTYCPIDLCGKHIRLPDSHQEDVSLLMSGDRKMAQLKNRAISLQAMQERVRKYKIFLSQLSLVLKTCGNETEVVLETYTRQKTVRFLVKWLNECLKRLIRDCEMTEIQQQKTTRVCRILTFDSKKAQHLIEFPDGNSLWMSLDRREYSVILPQTFNTVDNNLQDFQCGLLEAGTLTTHAEICCHRLLKCPLNCGQRLPAHSVEVHLSMGCNLRNSKCQLGCGEVMAIELLAKHEQEECTLRSVFCKHCHVLFPVQTMSLHLDKECQHRPRSCKLGCEMKVSWIDAVDHELTHCPKRFIQCTVCDAAIWFCEREQHENSECPLRVCGACEAGCGQCLRYNEITHHLLFSCTKRLIDCQQCKQQMPFESLSEHLTLLCVQRTVNCRKGCGFSLKEVEADTHENDECPKRLLFCENQCGLHVPSCGMDQHLSSKCSMRVMQCPTGCREWIFAYLFEDHWKRCRQRLVPCGVGGKLCARPLRIWHKGRKLVRCAVHGENALLWAVKGQDIDLVTYLLQNVDASYAVDEEFANGFSPLVLAASLQNVNLVQLLLRFGADVNFETSRGRTPLSEACIAQNAIIVRLLVENRANVIHTNRQGRNLIEMVHEYAASKQNNSQSDSKWEEIIQILEEQAALERDQRDLFLAIGCSHYEYITQCFKYSLKPSYLTAINPIVELEKLVNVKEKQGTAMCLELDEAVQVFNESIAETEAKRVSAIHLTSQVDDSCRRLQNVENAEEASSIDSNALEADMLAMIREITAQDIAQLLNSHVPSETSFVVVKALSLLCGAVPRGRRNATEYTDIEWWKTAQALLMDRSLLRRLRGYKQQEISPDVMSKVRRECLKAPAFAACAAAFKQNRTTFLSEDANGARERSANSQIPPAESLRGDIVGILATWIQGVEIEYKARSERQVLVERKRQLEVAVTATREKQQQAKFEAQVEARSLPARQEELEIVRHQCDVAMKELEVAKKQLHTYKLLNYAALSGHTPLTFACAVGNEAIVHMLLSHGASSGHPFEEQTLCASFIQVLVRDFQYRKRFERERRQGISLGGVKPRSDAAIEALVRNVAHAFIVGHFKRKLEQFRQTHRVALHEAVVNGNHEIAAILLAKDAKLWQKTYVLPERVYPGALLEGIAPVAQNVHNAVKHQGKWKLHPLVKEKQSAKSELVNTAERLDGPLTLKDTLNCAVKYYDSRVFKVSTGWEPPNVTFYSSTVNFVDEMLGKRDAEKNRWQTALVSRRNVLKKTTELKEKHNLLEKAISSRDFVAVSRLLDDGAFADYETSNCGLSALMASCIEEVYVRNEDNKDVLAVEFLLDRTMNRPLVNFESSRGLTALNTAAFYGTMKCAQVLINRGASLNLTSRLSGRTALMVAADNGKEAFVRFLLSCPQINVVLQDSSKKTALDYARSRSFVTITGMISEAMTGSRGRMVSAVSGLYGVCKWGCGFMTQFEDHLVQNAKIVKDINPLDHHELHQCPKRTISCPNNCGEENLWAEELKDHIEGVCELRLVRCPNQKCKVQFTDRNRVIHLQDQCEQRMVVCECGESMIYQRNVLHLQTQCPMRFVPCPLECKSPSNIQENKSQDFQVFQLRWKDVKVHVTGDCPHRNVRCRNGCTINDLLLEDRLHHETSHCLLRRVHCKWGCEESVLAGTQALHERDDCELRQQSCPNRCGLSNVALIHMQEHLSSICSWRSILCSLNCGRRVPLHTIESHQTQECRKRIVNCPQCDQKLMEEERATHQNTQCLNRLTLCRLCNQNNFTHAAMTQHRQNECKMRQVTCKYQCFVKSLLAHEKERHELWECAFRPIWCPLGCCQVFICNTLKSHQKTCSMRIVVCGNGCGEEVREKDRADHERFYCNMKKAQGKVSR